LNNIGCGIYDQDIYLLPSIPFAKKILKFEVAKFMYLF